MLLPNATKSRNDHFINHLQNAFADDVITGLKQTQKCLPSKYFYDQAGSRYFDEICQLTEYYPYRTELSMLPGIAKDLADVIDDRCDIIEFGAGSLVKIRILLAHCNNVDRYVPVDVAGEHLRDACEALANEFPQLTVSPIEADFTQVARLPVGNGHHKLGFFPGSTIGNFMPKSAVNLLARMREQLGTDAHLLIGVDTKKSPAVLHRAYNDSLGVTAKFNRNILNHINRELGSDFQPDKFEHYAFYNAGEGRIEMHLASCEDQCIHVNGCRFEIARGETIHTENSYKYSTDEFLQLAVQAGWESKRIWTDTKNFFAVYLFAAR